MTKYDMAVKFAEILKLPTEHLVRVDSIPEGEAVKRPIDSRLDVGRLKELGVSVECVDFAGWWTAYLRRYQR